MLSVYQSGIDQSIIDLSLFSTHKYPIAKPIDIFVWSTVGSKEKSCVIDSDSPINCPICGDDHIAVDGIIVCQTCGATLGAEIKNSSEVQYNIQDGTSQCNTVHNPLLNQTNYNTQIAGGNSHLKRLNLWSHTDYQEKTLTREFKNFEELCRKDNLTINVAHRSQLLYKEAIDRFHQRGQGKKRPVGLNMACLYYACKDTGVNRSHRELALLCQVTETRVIRGCKAYQNLMQISEPVGDPVPQEELSSESPSRGTGPTGLSSDKLICSKDKSVGDFEIQSENTESDDVFEGSNLEAYANRFIDIMGLNSEQKSQTTKVLKQIEKLGHFNQNPPSIVAGCLYLVSIIYNFHLSKSMIANQTGVSEVTIVKVYKELLEYLDQLID